MNFHLYGLIIGIGVVVGVGFASSVLQRKGMDGDVAWDGLWWVMVPGIVGARLYHVIDQWQVYKDDLLLILRLWMGGLGILGGIVGGILGLVAFSVLHARAEEKKAEEVFFALADVAVMGVILAQSIGRWGNYFNKELYGSETTSPWGILIDGVEGRYHPLFLYESVLDLLLFVILLLVYRGQDKRGSVFGSYLIGYGLIRIVLEGLRIESFKVLGISVAQTFGLGLIVVGVVILRRRRSFLRDEDLSVGIKE